MTYRKKLIEVALFLEIINTASTRVARHCEKRSVAGSDEAPPRVLAVAIPDTA
jgi:hypothetical protein